MIKVGFNQLPCYHFIYTGNCINRKECTKNHPDVVLKKRKKLKFDVKKDFVPDPNVISQIIVTMPQITICQCCKNKPFDCRGNEICIGLGKCFCISQQEIEDFISSNSQALSQLCDCCNNDFYNCKAILCKQLGMCQCQMREEMERPQDEFDDDVFIEEYSDCSCCKGYIYTCGNPLCMQTGSCFCLL